MREDEDVSQIRGAAKLDFISFPIFHNITANINAYFKNQEEKEMKHEIKPVTVNDFKEAFMDLVATLDSVFNNWTARLVLVYLSAMIIWLACASQPIYAMENTAPTTIDGEVLCVLPDSAITDQDGPAYHMILAAGFYEVKGPGIDPKNPLFKEVWDGHFKRYITYQEKTGHFKE